MLATNFKKKYNKSKKTNYRPKNKAACVDAKTVKSIVKREVHKNIEDKKALYVQNILPITSYANLATMQVQTCIPSVNITQSVGQSGRLGCTVRTRSLYFNMYLYPNPYNATSNVNSKPQIVQLFFGKIKGQRDRIPTNLDFSRLWQNGNSSTNPYSDLRDLTQQINNDYWTVYKIFTFKLGLSSYSGTGSNPAYQNFTNNDYKLNHVRKINLTKYCPKVLKFNDATLQPTNDNLYFWIQCINADGTQPVDVNYLPATFGYSSHYVYEDA